MRDGIIKKRGQSNLIVTILIILIILVLIVIIWNLSYYLLKSSSSNVIIDPITFNSCVYGDVVFNGPCIDVTLKRSMGDGELIGWKFILHNDSDSFSIENYESQYLITPQERKVIEICNFQRNITGVNSLEIIPVFKNLEENNYYGRAVTICPGKEGPSGSGQDQLEDNQIYIPPCIGIHCINLAYCFNGEYDPERDTWISFFGNKDSDENVITLSISKDISGGSIVNSYIGAGFSDYSKDLSRKVPYIIKLLSTGCIDYYFGYLGFKEIDRDVGYSTGTYSLMELGDYYYAVGGTWDKSKPNLDDWSTNFGDCYLVKLDKSGNVIWEKEYGSEEYKEICKRIVKTDSGDLVLGGSINKTGLREFLLIKVNPENGEEIENSTFEAGNGVLTFMSSSNGGLIFGTSASSIPYNYGLIKRVDFDFNPIWEFVPPNFRVYPTGMVYSNGKYAMGGQVGSKSGILFLDDGGNWIGNASYIGTIFDGIANLSDGYLLSGRGSNPSRNNSVDAYVVKSDLNGNLIWEKYYGGNDVEYGKDPFVSLDSDNFYVFSGWSRSLQGEGRQDVFVMRINSTGDNIDASKNWTEFFA